MLVKFHQAVHLKGKSGKGKEYPRGTHEVPLEHLTDPHFYRLVRAGMVSDAEAIKTVSVSSLQDFHERLVKRISATPHHTTAPVAEPPGDVIDSAAPDREPAVLASPADPVTPAPKGSKKPKKQKG